MGLDLTPKDYVITDYVAYQEHYRDNPRESDKVILKELGRILESRPDIGPVRILDVGCHTGNLIRHILGIFPGVLCTGVDVFEEVIDHCRARAELSECTFNTADVRALPYDREFDVVMASAVLCRFDRGDFEISLRSLAKSLRRGGYFVSFEYYHEWAQHLSIIERSSRHPEGLSIHMRSIPDVQSSLERAGFSEYSFSPFRIACDLTRPEDGDPLMTYTVRTEDGERLNFRGALYQPWCHLVARKAG